MYRRLFKPLIDYTVALIVLLLTLPVTVIVAILLWWHHRGNPFFLQPRPGQEEKIFNIIKFKTMTDRRDTHGLLLPDAQRLTSLGKWVRKTSLDELPQLINVLKGDMSLIGPRPLLVEYLPLYDARQRHRHDVKPGITGWAQVNGRNAISWQQKFDYDIFYVENLSFLLDLQIAWLTIRKVLKKEGINATHAATAEKFNGQN
ncbi:MAG: sugar transferase [Runella sp.]